MDDLSQKAIKLVIEYPGNLAIPPRHPAWMIGIVIPRSFYRLFARSEPAGNEQTYLSRTSYELHSLVQICPFGRAGFRARVQRDVYRRKARYPSGMLRPRDPRILPTAALSRRHTSVKEWVRLQQAGIWPSTD